MRFFGLPENEIFLGLSAKGIWAKARFLMFLEPPANAGINSGNAKLKHEF
jgi:hypothetical protein